MNRTWRFFIILVVFVSFQNTTHWARGNQRSDSLPQETQGVRTREQSVPQTQEGSAPGEGQRPKDASAGAVYANQGLAHHRKNEYESAIKNYTIAIDLGFGDPMVFCNRGAALAASNKFPEAIRDFDEAIKRGQVSLVYANRGLTYLKQNAYELAARDITKALENGDPPILKFDRGMANWKLNKADAALRDFNAAIELNPKAPSFFRMRGFLYMNSLGEHRKAIKDLDETIRLDPNDVEAYLGKAIAYQCLGKIQEYESELGKAQKVNSREPAIYFQKGLLCLGRAENSKAIACFEKALQLEKEYGLPKGTAKEDAHFVRGRFLYFLAESYRAEGQNAKSKTCFDGALLELSNAIKLQPFDPMYYEIRAKTLRGMGRHKEAKEDDEKMETERAKTKKRE